MNITRLMVITAALLASRPAFAQTATLKGTVKDSFTGTPIVGATVSVLLNGVPLNKSTLSGPDGTYSISDLPVNKVLTRFRMFGYSPDPDDIEKVLMSGDNSQNAALVPQTTSSQYWQNAGKTMFARAQAKPANQQQATLNSEWSGLLQMRLPAETLIVAAQGFASVVPAPQVPQSALQISKVDIAAVKRARIEVDRAFKTKSEIPSPTAPLLNSFPDEIKAGIYRDSFSQSVPQQDKQDFLKQLDRGTVLADRKTMEFLKYSTIS